MTLTGRRRWIQALGLAFLLGNGAFAEEMELAALPSHSLEPLRIQPANQHEQVREMASRAFFEEKTGNYPEALRLYAMALSAYPGQPWLRESLDRLSFLIHQRGERKLFSARARYVEEALRRSETLGFQQDGVEALSLEGRRLVGQGVVLAGVDMLYQALEKNPAHEESLRGLDLALKKILKRLQKSRFDSPQQRAAYQGMARYIEKDWLGAIEPLERAIRMGALSQELSAAHLPEYAVKARKQMDLALWRSERDGIFRQAKQLHDEGRWLEAEPLFKRILTSDPGDGEAAKFAATTFQKAEEVRSREREDARLAGLKEALGRARRAAEAGDSLTVLEAAADALLLEPSDQEALGYLKASQERLQKQGFMAPEVPVMDDAEKAYRRALRHYGNDEPEEALKAVEEALAANPEHADAKALKGHMTSASEEDSAP